MQRMIRENLSDEASSFRRKRGIFYLFMAVLATALMLAFFVPRGVLYVPIVLYFLGIHDLISAKMKFCSIQSYLNQTSSPDGKFTKVIQCPITRGKLHGKAKRLLLFVFFLAAFCATIGFCLSFAIEAGTGKSYS